MARPRRHVASYATLDPGEEIELYEVGEDANDSDAVPHLGGYVRVLDVDCDGSGPHRIRVSSVNGASGNLDFSEDRFEAYRVEGARR